MNERIKMIRDALNLSAEAFGERVGVTRSAISNIENNRRNVTTQLEKAICREYNVNPVWLSTGEGEMFVEPSYDDMELSEELLKPENKRYLEIFKYCQKVFTDEDWEDITRIIKKSYEIIEQMEKDNGQE